jgi:phosphotransferase system HPr (HPr) family protein
MHLRPCALLVKTVRPYRSSVEVETEGRRVSGRSILDLLSLGAHYGSKMTFIITGEDASRAMVAVQRLFDRHFADAYRSVPAPVEAVPIAHSHR